MLDRLEREISDYQKFHALFSELGPMGYTIALNIRNTTPDINYSTYPESWIDKYTKHSFLMADPVVDYLFTTSGTTRWSDIEHTRGPDKTQQFLTVSSEEGLNFGAAIVRRSMKTPSVKSLLSVARQDRELTDTEMETLEHAFFSLLAAFDDTEHLTTRQTEILTLMAKGATRNQSAIELGISPETIKKDVELARAILDAKNLTEAVAIAITRKLIRPIEGPVW